MGLTTYSICARAAGRSAQRGSSPPPPPAGTCPGDEPGEVDARAEAPHHGRRMIGCCVEERLAGQLVAVGEQLPDRAMISPRRWCSPPTPGRPPASTGRAARRRLAGLVTRRSSCSADRRRPAGSSPTGTGRRQESHPEAGSAPRPRLGRCPTRALVEATRHPRHQQPSKPAQRRGVKAGLPPATVSAVSASIR